MCKARALVCPLSFEHGNTHICYAAKTWAGLDQEVQPAWVWTVLVSMAKQQAKKAHDTPHK